MNGDDILFCMMTAKSTPPATIPSVILKLEIAYSLWHQYIIHFPKVHRYSLGAKIDTLLCEVIQYSSSALFVSKEQKIAHIQKAIQCLDTSKILLRIANTSDIMETKQYIVLIEKLVEIGKMLGGWHNQVIAQNPVR
jgi:hypothetical protein